MGFLALLLAIAALYWANRLSRRVRELEDELKALSLRLTREPEKPHAAPADAPAAPAQVRDVWARQPSPPPISTPPVPLEADAAPERTEAMAAATAAPQPERPAAPEVAQPAAPLAPTVEEQPPHQFHAAPEVAAAQDERGNRGWNFEDLFGRRLPVWGGGIALALAGFFLVKYSIETGLVTPAVRVLLGFLFGVGLIGGAEAARRIPRLAVDPRMSQALAGAGIATLYGVIYMATSLYGLMSPGLGFAGMAGVTAVALLLSLRHGAPAAVLGLLGGFTTPVLVNTGEGSVPALLGYLLLTIGGLLGVARVREWRWLGMLALVGGFGWSSVLLAADLAETDSLALGLFLVLMAIGALLALGGERRADASRLDSPRLGVPRLDIIVPGAAAALAFVQLAVLIGKGGFGWMEWGLYALLAAGVTVLAVRDARHLLLPPAALAIALFTFAVWTDPSERDAALVAAGMVLLFAVPGYGLAGRSGSGLIWSAQAVAATVLPAIILSLQAPLLLPDPGWALLYLVLAAPAVWAALRMRRQFGAETADPRSALFLSAAAVLVALAAMVVLPRAYIAAAFMAISVGLAWLAMTWRDLWLGRATAAAVGTSALASVVTASDFSANFSRLVAEPDSIAPGDGLLCFLLPALLLIPVAWWERNAHRRSIYTAGGVFFLALAVVQLVTMTGRPFVLAVLAVALVEAARVQDRLPLRRPILAVGALALLWTMPPVLHLTGATLMAAVGNPLLVSDLPEVQQTSWALLLPGLALGLAAWRLEWPADRWRRLGQAAPAALVLMAGFVFYKHAWGMREAADFIAHGFAERVLLTQLLFAAGAAAYAVADRLPHGPWLGRALTALAAVRFVWFDLLVFNPLFVAQQVGDWPIINLLPLAYGLPVYWLARLHRTEPLLTEKIAVAAKGLSVLALTLLVGLSVRQIFQGGLLTEGRVGTAEHYAYSAAGLVTAIGLLLWGAWRQDQTTRIASLALMLLTIGKVFLIDAAALEGLLRIASFVGLGLSLIGISWFYTRHVFKRTEARAE